MGLQLLSSLSAINDCFGFLFCSFSSFCQKPYLSFAFRLRSIRNGSFRVPIFGNFVITSYSIHYTKLYEGTYRVVVTDNISGCVDSLDAVVGRPAICEQPCGLYVESTTNNTSCPDTDDGVAVITSYSIHYTKLYDLMSSAVIVNVVLLVSMTTIYLINF